MINIFFKFLCFSFSDSMEWTWRLSAEEWRTLLNMSKRQTLVGVMFAGIQKLNEEYRPSKEVLLEWFALAERIKQSNRRMNEGCEAVAIHFEKNGFYTCILKGQGNAQMYEQPLLRTPGDIDIWVWPKNEEFGNSTLSERRRKVVHFVTTETGKQPCFYHHVDYPKFEPIEVEVHFTPTWLHCPMHNRTLQRFFEAEAEKSFDNRKKVGDGQCAVPTWKLNVVFQLIHLQNHLIGEGIGLRQMMDYYYLLLQREEAEIECVQKMIDQLGLKHFASATMWVLHKVFGLNEEYFIASANKNLGEFLLHEIMLSGNFGHYDVRIDRKHQQRLLTRVWFRFVRSLKFYKMCGTEIRWTIPFKLWHYFWRKQYNQ